MTILTDVNNHVHAAESNFASKNSTVTGKLGCKGGFPLIENFPQTGKEKKLFRGKERRIFL